MSCGQWLPAEDRYCGQRSRDYLPGPRCADHTPAKQAGRPEPPDPQETQ